MRCCCLIRMFPVKIGKPCYHKTHQSVPAPVWKSQFVKPKIVLMATGFTPVFFFQERCFAVFLSTNASPNKSLMWDSNCFRFCLSFGVQPGFEAFLFIFNTGLLGNRGGLSFRGEAAPQRAVHPGAGTPPPFILN